MGKMIERSGGVCPRCGHVVERINLEAARQFGETEYVCPQCAWMFETGLDLDGGELV
ncbi:hypothetical protein [Microbacterium testaceum]|jgi:predicted RNA-binding Zn-ribbon protein involved in translation (DUF1610 family)|uniref:hypothetical protein n=1 Tax=Microbacterium testaceum TaxID=2033 RepID=UPI000ACCF8E1|nr:hypothetical protein [Microbacterium testaceum]